MAAALQREAATLTTLCLLTTLTASPALTLYTSPEYDRLATERAALVDVPSSRGSTAPSAAAS